MKWLKLTVFETHEYPEVKETEDVLDIVFTPSLKDGWLKFKFVFDYDETKVLAYKEYPLFDLEGNPVNCTKVFLSDGTCLFVASTLETFETKLNDFLKD